VVTPAGYREAAGHLQAAYEMSERRACRVLGVDRTSVRYQTTRPDDGALRDRLKALAQERRRFGYRRLHVLLRREGHAVNEKRVQRIYREERLTVRRRGGRKRAMGTRRPLDVPLAANQRWSLDFVADQMTDGRRFRILTVIDNCTRECLALVADTSLSGARVARELDAVIRQRAGPTPSSATTARNTPRTGSWPGPTTLASAGTTSRRASPSRTASTKASTGACVTSC
jgi:putative transposase